jgi:hypothetical protein
MTSVKGEAELERFRAGLTGRHALDLLRASGGRLLVQLPVGVGKSRWLDGVTVEAGAAGGYDLVVVLCPTRGLIAERAPRRDPPPGVKVVVLRPRPSRRCGEARDARWRRLEAADLGALGRAEVCGGCPRRQGCYWPGQYGKALRGARIVFATQAHLTRSPRFIADLRAWTGAGKVLTLLDESDFIGRSSEEVIAAEDLVRFTDVLGALSGLTGGLGRLNARWRRRVEELSGASTADLQHPGWRMPPVRRRWALAVQRAGVDRSGDAFRFPAYGLARFGHSPVETRRRAEDGGLEFGNTPLLGDCVVFSGTTDTRFARHRLGGDFASPFAGHVFAHPETRWFNLASPVGSRRYFRRHADQVLDLFAQLTARRAAEGKRVLLVAKKAFVGLCAAGLDERFGRLGAPLRVVTRGWSERLLADPGVVPLIHFGTIGTNLFERFDAAYCLTSFYVNEAVVDGCLQDLTRRDLRLPIRIETAGSPRRRRAGVTDPGHRFYDVAWLAQSALEFKEHAAVVRAVGRVRPFTRPREVVTFQMANLPGVTYDAEFRNLAEARRFFAVPPGGQLRRSIRAAQAAALRQSGLTQEETARRLGVSMRTVRNYENP